MTERYLSAAELLQAGVFAFGGPPLQVLLRVTIDLDLELAITYINVEACGGSADMVGPPVDCDTTEEDEELVERVIGGFLF